MTREIGPELVARIRRVADSLEAIARGEADSPQPVEQTQSVGPAPAECSRSERGSARLSADSVGWAGPTLRNCPAAWLAVAADSSESSAVYMLKEQAEAAAREWGWMVVPLYPFPALWPEDEIAIEAAWERTGLAPTWPADEPQTGVRCANAMADEILRLRHGQYRVQELERMREMLLEERKMWRRTHMTLTTSEREAVEAAVTRFDVETAAAIGREDLRKSWGGRAKALRFLLERTK